MIGEGKLLRERFSVLLSWERSRRRESIVVVVFFYSVLASLVALPAHGALPAWLSLFFLPPALFVVLAPGFFLGYFRDRHGASLRAISAVDRRLGLEERALTAWEIVARGETRLPERGQAGAPEAQVLKEAWERLSAEDLRALVRRRLPWQALLTPPLFVLWLLLVWLDGGWQWQKGIPGSQPVTLAQKVKDFSRDLKEKAEAQGLSESLKLARALEQVAERNLRGEIGEKQLEEDVVGLTGAIEDLSPMAPEGVDALFAALASREALLDLKAELEAAKSILPAPSLSGRDKLEAELLSKLGSLPRLREELEKRHRPLQGMSRSELNRVLEQLRKGVDSELDRRTLLEIRDFIASLLKDAQGIGTREAVAESGRAAHDLMAQGEKMKGHGSVPGHQPAAEGDPPATAPSLKSSAVTHLKGLLGEGGSSSAHLRGGISSRKSGVSDEEIVADYRRQAEEELASEQVPEARRETVKRYFLSLGLGGQKR